MSVTVTVNKQATSQQTQKDDPWLSVGRVLGYPDSWMQYLKDSLAKEGKSYQWKIMTPNHEDSSSAQKSNSENCTS